MKLVEVIVDRGAIGDLRDALRDLGVRTLRIGEAGEKQEHFIRGISGQATESESSGHPRAKVSVAVPDDIADRVAAMLLSAGEGGEARTTNESSISIEHVVRLEAAGFFDLAEEHR